jgi:hypothetical protein
MRAPAAQAPIFWVELTRVNARAPLPARCNYIHACDGMSGLFPSAEEHSILERNP